MQGDAFKGVRLSVNIFVGATLLWVVLLAFGGLNPIWAVASLVAASDPEVKQALSNIRARLINSVAGCSIGLLFLLPGGASEWKLPFAMAISALVSSYVVRVQTMWRQCPITAALVIASGLTQHSNMTGLEVALRRVFELLLGALVGASVSWLMSRVWRMAPKPHPAH